jgi:membrane-bound lytic murein transglycosylase D
MSPWTRLRARFAMDGCTYRPEVQHFARHYARWPRTFAASWKQAMPFLLLVLDELERRDLPGEFALLPYLESNYRPLPGRGNGPAGMWQIVPSTARAAGLAVGEDYDGRLDALESTRAALDLIERYQRQFADWRLADMAFSSGEYRVRKLLGERDARTLAADELSRLAFAPGTHEHLDRLLALACIVEHPARFGVTLPEPRPQDRLQAVVLQGGMDLRVAANLADVPITEVRRWNAAWRGNRMAADFAPRLLLPETTVADFQQAAASVPVALWGNWREQVAGRTSRLASWSSETGVPATVLAAANGLDPQETVLPATRLLLPGQEPRVAPPVRRDAAPRSHVVVAGDTLSRIARKAGISLRRLQQLNPDARTLRIGQSVLLEE